MILIFSKESDFSTDHVIDWLAYYKVEYLRINGDDENQLQNLVLTELENVNAIWFRRSYVHSDYEDLPFPLENFIRREYAHFYKYSYDKIVTKFGKAFNLNKYADLYNNKLSILKMAERLDIKIPPFIVTTKKDEVKKFLATHRMVIIKPISDLFTYSPTSDKVYIPYTKELTKDILDVLPSRFTVSLFQKNIQKEFEIRIVYFLGEMYSMAIFNARNEKTKDDYRNYDYENKNRQIPFELPDKLEYKINELCKRLDINFCSIDLIYNGLDYYLLEINPVGQFGMTSYPCNYKIEKKIAKKLINKYGKHLKLSSEGR